MKVLAMNTATPDAGVALLDGQTVVAVASLAAGPGQVASLPLVVARLLNQAGWRCRQLDLLVVTLGPGSFTGVRMALALAKGMALANQTPLVGITTLEALAAGMADQVPPGTWLLPVLAAGRGEVFAGLVQTQEEGLVLVGEISCLVPDGLTATFSQQVPADQPLIRCEALTMDVVALARLGIRRYQTRGGADPLLEPVYVRPSDAERTARAVAG